MDVSKTAFEFGGSLVKKALDPSMSFPAGMAAGAAGGMAISPLLGLLAGRFKQKPDALRDAGAGMGGQFVGGFPAAIGAGMAPAGHRHEGMGRGLSIGSGAMLGGGLGGLTGAGLGAVAGLGINAATGGNQEAGLEAAVKGAIPGALVGGGLGAYGGGKAVQKAIGKPTWDKKDGDGDGQTDEHADKKAFDIGRLFAKRAYPGPLLESPSALQPPRGGFDMSQFSPPSPPIKLPDTMPPFTIGGDGSPLRDFTVGNEQGPQPDWLGGDALPADQPDYATKMEIEQLFADPPSPPPSPTGMPDWVTAQKPQKPWAEYADMGPGPKSPGILQQILAKAQANPGTTAALVGGGGLAAGGLLAAALANRQKPKKNAPVEKEAGIMGSLAKAVKPMMGAVKPAAKAVPFARPVAVPPPPVPAAQRLRVPPPPPVPSKIRRPNMGMQLPG